MKILRTKQQLRYTQESAKRLLFEPAPPPPTTCGTTLDPTTVVASVLSNGNLTVTADSALTNDQGAYVGDANLKTGGKFYFEVTVVGIMPGGWSYAGFGVCRSGADFYNLGNDGTGGAILENGYLYNNGTSYSGALSLAEGDIVGVLADLDDRQIQFTGVSGSQAGISTPVIPLISGALVPFGGLASPEAGDAMTFNFGATPFAGALPGGYLAGWCWGTYIPPAVPNVSDVEPHIGDYDGDFGDGQAIVNITGSGFLTATNVYFGGDTADSYTINSDTSITAIQPGNSAGQYQPVTVDVRVENDFGESPVVPGDKYTFARKWPEEAMDWSLAVNATRIWSVASYAGAYFDTASMPTERVTYFTNYLDLSQADTTSANWANVGPPGQILLDANYAYYISNQCAVITRVPLAGTWADRQTLVIPAGMWNTGYTSSSGVDSAGGIWNSCIYGGKLYIAWGGKWAGVTNRALLLVIDLVAWLPTAYNIYEFTDSTTNIGPWSVAVTDNGTIVINCMHQIGGTPLPTGCIVWSTVAAPGTFTRVEMVYTGAFCCSKGNIVYITEREWSQTIGTRLIVIDCSSGTPAIGYVSMTDDPNFAIISEASQNYTSFPFVSDTHFFVAMNYTRGSPHAGPGLEHPGLARRTLATSVGASADPYLSDVVLLLGFDTTGLINQSDMWDESPKRRGIATWYYAPTTSTAQTKFSAYSLYQYQNQGGVAWPAHTDFDFSNQPFTIECWLYLTRLGAKQGIITAFDSFLNRWAWGLVVDNDNTLKWLNSTDGTSATVINQLVSSSTMTANVWHHIAVDFDGTTARLYTDGNCVATSTTIRNIHSTLSTANITLMNDNEAYTYWPAQGYMSQLRITKGVARYASSTTYPVPTAAFPRGGAVAGCVAAGGQLMKNVMPWEWQWLHENMVYYNGNIYLQSYAMMDSDPQGLTILPETLASATIYPLPPPTLPVPTVNDNFANAIDLTGQIGVSLLPNCYYSTYEPGETNPAGAVFTGSTMYVHLGWDNTNYANFAPEHGLWYKFTAPTTALYQFSVGGPVYPGSPPGYWYDGVDIAACTGSAVGAVTWIAQHLSQGYSSDQPYHFVFQCTAGQTYHIRTNMWDESNEPIEFGYGFKIRADGVATGTPPSFVNAAAQASSVGTSVTPPLPGSRATGNILIAVARARDGMGTGQITMPSIPPGTPYWNLIENTTSGYCTSDIWYTVCDGTEVPPTFQYSGVAETLTAQVFQYTGGYVTYPYAYGSRSYGYYAKQQSSDTLGLYPVRSPACATLSAFSTYINVSVYSQNTGIWNAGDVSGTVTLSGDKMSATSASGASTNCAIRGTLGKTAGKWYMEWTVLAGGADFSTSTNDAVGIATLTASLSSWVSAHQTAGVGINLSTGHVWQNTVDTGIVCSPINPGVYNNIGMALDMDNKRVWFRAYGGYWNNNSANNPATNVGGIDISALFTSGMAAYPVCGMFQNGDGATMNMGQLVSVFAIPTGFSLWDADQPVQTPSTPAGFTTRASGSGGATISDVAVQISSAPSGAISLTDTGMAAWTNFLFELRSQ